MSSGPSAGVRTIDYYFSLVSPWAYIGHAIFAEMQVRHSLRVRYHPVNLSTVFPQSGGLPLLQRHPSRQRYRMMELQRWRDRRGLVFHLKPKFWPFDVALADRVATSLAAADADLERFLPLAFKGVWEDDRDLADPEVLADLLRKGGFDAEKTLVAARSEPVGALYDWNTETALDDGVFGSPSYVLEREVFWGQDRLELLEDALASARGPYRG